MDRRTYAAWTVAAGLIIGLIANIFFYHAPYLGLSVLLFALIVTGAVLASARIAGLPLRLRNLWPLLPLLFFAGMVAVRADPSIIFFNLCAVLLLGALVLYYLPLQHALDEDTTGQHVRAVTVASMVIPFQPIPQAFEAAAWVREQKPLRQGPALAVIRGLLFTLPVLIVFGLLLASADAIFSEQLKRITDLFRIQNVTQLTTQLFVIGVFAWLGCGALAYAVNRGLKARETSLDTPAPTPAEPEPEPGDEQEPGEPVLAFASANGGVIAQPVPAAVRARPITAKPESKPKKHPFVLGMIEATMMLASVDLLFGAFVVVQLAYFFGGQENIGLEGWTYAQYARRGFFELVAVSVMTLGLVLWLDDVTVRHSQRQHGLFRGLAVLIVGLTGVMLVSAFQRMGLYESAFGFTHLRVYVHVFIVWLGVLFAVFLLSLFRVRERVFSLGTLLVIIGYLVTMNLMNVEGYIAERNVARYLNNEGVSGLDACYLRTLSADALPAMLMLYQRDDSEFEEVKTVINYWLLNRLNEAETAAEGGLRSYNASRAAALAQLSGMREQLVNFQGTADIRCTGLERYDFD